MEGHPSCLSLPGFLPGSPQDLTQTHQLHPPGVPPLPLTPPAMGDTGPGGQLHLWASQGLGSQNRECPVEEPCWRQWGGGISIGEALVAQLP